MGALAMLLGVLALCGPTRQYDQQLVNNVGDFILKNLKIFNPASLPLKNKTRSYAGGTAEVETNLGAIYDFRTLKRVGDIDLEFEEGSASVDFRFKLDKLRVRYDEYKLKMFGKVISTGILEVTVDLNEIQISVDMGHKSLCFLTIYKLEIVQLDGLNVHLYEHGSQELSYWKSTILNPIVSYFTDTIKEKVQKKLKKKLPKIIKPNKYLCKDDEL